MLKWDGNPSLADRALAGGKESNMQIKSRIDAKAEGMATESARGRRRRRPGSTLLGLLLTCSVGALPAPVVAAPQEGVPAESPAGVWVGPDGKTLPFQNHDEVLEYLRTAEIVNREPAPEGINRPDVLTLEANGVRARAILRQVASEKTRIRIGERFYFHFYDSYANECAAYDLARELGLGFVPPAIPRNIERPGSVQIWIEGGRNAADKNFRPKSPMGWMKQVWDKDLFDNLILNVDRNPGNMLVGDNDELWLIDHTRAFQPNGELLAPEALQKINRKVWDRLEALSDDDLRDVVRDFLQPDQVEGLIKRRELLQEKVGELVAKSGEGAVFY